MDEMLAVTVPSIHSRDMSKLTALIKFLHIENVSWSSSFPSNRQTITRKTKSSRGKTMARASPTSFIGLNFSVSKFPDCILAVRWASTVTPIDFRSWREI